MKKSMTCFSIIIQFLLGTTVWAAVGNPNVQLKTGAIKNAAPRVMSFSTTGTIQEMLCEDHEILIRSSVGEEFRVFPTVSIAGNAVNGNAALIRLCRQHLCFQQNVRVRGEKLTINGRNAISKASVMPLSECQH